MRACVCMCMCVCMHKYMYVCLRAFEEQEPGFQLVIWGVFPEIASDS